MIAAPMPADTASPTTDASTFKSLDPATGEVVASFAVHTEDEVKDTV
ncbi:MAG: hypothetical protein QOD87_1709, partial [Pseudonocardiales bacterium]|nr:hypothetical protein [Pseudonocardiales bacterium]